MCWPTLTARSGRVISTSICLTNCRRVIERRLILRQIRGLHHKKWLRLRDESRWCDKSHPTINMGEPPMPRKEFRYGACSSQSSRSQYGRALRAAAELAVAEAFYSQAAAARAARL